jgi:mannose-6-phosphate isomerase-like protein (cupin superfamily)
MNAEETGTMKDNLPTIVTLSGEASATETYDNHAIAYVNDHVVRISTMTQPYPWHFHPNSDETFLVVEGGLVIEFEHGQIRLGPGQMATVPRGVRHRTRPVGHRSVNLTFEAGDTTTELSQASV